MDRRLFPTDKLEKVYQSALKVLKEMGMKVESEPCLQAMEKFGCRVDYAAERALFSEEVITRVLEMARQDIPGWKPEFPRIPAEYSIGGGGTCPFYLDETSSDRRRAGEEDCIQALKIVDTASVAACEVPVYNGDQPPKFDSIRCIQLGIETLRNTICGGVDLFFPEQVPFAVELGVLYRGDPSWFLPAGNCPTSPLIVGKLIADLAVAKAPYKTRYAVPTMPVMGANAPMTPLGAAVVGTAEILGGYVLAKSLNPATPVGACALSAMMDMKTGNMVYNAPEVFMADLAVCETFEHLLGLPCSVFSNYVDAKLPGMRAAGEKLMRCLGLGLYGAVVGSGLQGVLDQGKVFSPTQLMLDRDAYRFLAKYTAGTDASEENLATDVILEVAWDKNGYMMNSHTIRHMREIWNSDIFGRTCWLSMKDEIEKEKKHLQRARELWRENLRNYQPPDHPDSFLRDLKKICDRARKTLV